MKKIDKLVLKAFLQPFILTFSVIVFILLTVQMMNYITQIFGKDLSYIDLSLLVMHFSIFQTPIAFPLAIMLASLITFGNLGEHFELTAIKSAGISLTRAMLSVFIFVIFITILAFFSNNYLVPHSALKAYSLLYDIRQKKPTLDIEPGLFYGGIDKYRIKVDKKRPNGNTLLGIIIYNHTDRNGNNNITIADSGSMYTIMDNQYLKFELFSGSNYIEGKDNSSIGRVGNRNQTHSFTRTFFQKSEVIFDLSSFGMSRTDEGLFSSNRLMRNFNELSDDLDSLSDNIDLRKSRVYEIPKRFMLYSTIKDNTNIPKEIIETQERINKKNKDDFTLKQETKSKKISAKKEKTNMVRLPQTKKESQEKIGFNLSQYSRIKNITLESKPSSTIAFKMTGEKISELIEKESIKHNKRALKAALTTSRQVKNKLFVHNIGIKNLIKSYLEFKIQWHKMLSTAAACLSMFLIGAPLGAIIKRGGMGVPVLISIIFFIIYYVISIGAEKYAASGKLPVFQAVWLANIILFPIGLFFLRQARNDARLFELDYYRTILNNGSQFIKKRLTSKN